MCESCMCPKPLPSSLLQGDKLRRFVNPSKSFRSQRKTYLPLRSTYACWQCLSNGNRHASPKADEVARNGAFGKILRPEVFPDAPLHFPRPSTSLSRLKPVPLSFPALPRESSPGMRISRETGGLGLSLPSDQLQITLRPEPTDPARRCRLGAIV
jgi:hypothetical protein